MNGLGPVDELAGQAVNQQQRHVSAGAVLFEVEVDTIAVEAGHVGWGTVLSS